MALKLPKQSTRKPTPKVTMQHSFCHGRRASLLVALIVQTLVVALPGCSLAQVSSPANVNTLDGKNLSAKWVESLTERGAPQTYTGDALKNIGMPVGGIGAGQLYFGGDGKLWLWDIFNIPYGTYGEHYANPLKEASPIAQGFALKINSGDHTQTRTLDQKGFSDVTFTGQYPVGVVHYSDPSCPVAISMSAYSPFVPLDPEISSLPATLMQITLRNTSSKAIGAGLTGWLQNAVCNGDHSGIVFRSNQVIRDGSLLFVNASAKELADTGAASDNADVTYEDFDSGSYGKWTTTGNAFGSSPLTGNGINQHLTNYAGSGLANSYGPTNSDAATGTITSPVFTIDHRFIKFLIGGGNYPGATCVNLLVDSKVVRTSTGDNTDALKPAAWYVGNLKGQQAQLQIVNAATGGWGHVDVDNIVFTDSHPAEISAAIESRPDYGTMGLALLDSTSADIARPEGLPSDLAASLPDAGADQGATGSLGRRLTLAPGESKTVTFAVVWFFPNLTIAGLHDPGGRHYANRFSSAADVASYVNTHLDSLRSQTQLWRDTWYDSTLPYWFLNRTFANTSSMATSAEYWLKSGRFYAWEGVGFCPGNCTHVYEYAQAMARIFPSLERDERQRVDYGIGFHPDSGMVGFRAEFDQSEATDGQAGILLRTYREYQMSADNSFLEHNWPLTKKAMQFLIAKDTGQTGILTDGQPNTLDTTWYGEVPWITSLYIASLRAAHEMALVVGDSDFAQQTQTIADRGMAAFDGKMWNGEYFQQQVDPAHARATGAGDGCEIDQVLGQSWAFQVGLPRVIEKEYTLKALDGLWKYNYLTDVGPYIAAHRGGRPFALPGEAGVVMCTFPKNSDQDRLASTTGWQAGYFNECMSGFEHALASEMIWDGMTVRGLAIEKSIDDRYSAEKRNPYNEVEAGDHYGRAMASYGVFLAACGYQYNGPKGFLAFAPKISPEHFKAAFTSAAGWGSYSQSYGDGMFVAMVAVKYGELKLSTLQLAPPSMGSSAHIAARLNGHAITCSYEAENGNVIISLPADLTVHAGQTLQVNVGYSK